MTAASLFTALLLVASTAETPPEPEACAVVISAPAQLKKRSLKRIRASLGITVKRAGYARIKDKKLELNLPAYSDPALADCLGDDACLKDLSTELGAPNLLLIRLRRQKKKFEAEISMWHTLWRSKATELLPTSRKRLSLKLDLVAADVIADFKVKLAEARLANEEAQRAAEEMAAEAPVVPVAVVPGAAPPHTDAEGEVLAATPGQDTPALVETDDEFHDPDWGKRKSPFAFQLGAFGAFSPLVHRPTVLRVGRNIPDNILGTAAAGLALRLRLPLGMDEFYLTVVAAYAFDEPLLAVHAGAGFEKRFDLGRVLPLFGVRYRAVMLGLPVPSGSGQGLALALSHGVEAYAGIALSLHPAPLCLQLDLGYRWFPKRTNQFGFDGSVYYARDTGGEVWFLDPSGPTAALALIVEF